MQLFGKDARLDGLSGDTALFGIIKQGDTDALSAEPAETPDALAEVKRKHTSLHGVWKPVVTLIFTRTSKYRMINSTLRWVGMFSPVITHRPVCMRG